MNQHLLLTLTGNGFLVWAALVATASVIVHARVTWWKSAMGKHLMAYMVAMAATLDLGVIKLIIGDSPGFATLRLVVFIAVPIVMTWRLLLQLQAQRAVREVVAPDPSPAPVKPTEEDAP